MRVLILEDNEDVALLEKMLLERAGHEVVVVSQVDALLFEPAMWADIDAAVVDLMLAGSNRNGLFVTEWLRDHAPQVRRVIVSAMVNVMAYLPSSLAERISKPFDPEHFVAVVEGRKAGTCA